MKPNSETETDFEHLSRRLHALAEHLGRDLSKLAAVIEPHAGEEPEIGRLVLSMLSSLGHLVQIGDHLHEHSKTEPAQAPAVHP